MRAPSADLIFDTLVRVHEAMAAHDLWHALAYGTLLGAVRDGDVIPWDTDFDLLARPVDTDAILALQDQAELARHRIALRLTEMPARANLALDTRRIGSFRSQAISVFRDGDKLGDLYLFSLFCDGVLRRYDFASETYWYPHSSFPHFFVERLEQATLRDRAFPSPQHADRWLAGVYGADWRVPYRSERLGGEPREGSTPYGDRYEPRLADEIAWCQARGWDREGYRRERRWPRAIAGAGPIGTTPRTQDKSRAFWWRDVDELMALF